TADADEVARIGENGTMPRKLSSPFQTWVHRIGSIIALVFAVFVVLRLPLPAGNSFKLMLALWFTIFVYAAYRAFRLKTVELKGEDLLISNFGEQIRVPLNTVAAVKGGLGGKNPIKLQFRIATDFGESITFVPPQRRSMWPWQRHPLVKELQDLCRLEIRQL
ncbi:MAG TPA: hypothetical protein VG056_04820, partial [Pirellulales bacterium]|nr:hypothetical protein [Pirellulales bacterium]